MSNSLAGSTIRRVGAAFFLLTLAACATASRRSAAEPEGSLAIVMDDVRHFVEAMGECGTACDTAQVLESRYFARATPGLRAYREKYPFGPPELLAAIRRWPEDYAGIPARLEWLGTVRDSIRRVHGVLEKMGAGPAPLPAYLLVAHHIGANSGSGAGALIPIEGGAGQARAKANLAELVVHEMTHVYQFSAIGMDRYQTLYGPRKSILAISIREGIADFLAQLVTGRTTQERAAAYVRANRAETWKAFQRDMCSAETGEWMWTRPKDPSKPSSVGYAVGAEIAKAYYEAHSDKRAAVREMIAVDDYPEFLRRSGYARSQGVSDSVLAC